MKDRKLNRNSILGFIIIGIIIINVAEVSSDCSTSAQSACDTDFYIVNNWISSPVYKEQNVTEMCRASDRMWSCLVNNNCSLTSSYLYTRNFSIGVCNDLLSDNCTVFVQSDCAHDIHVVTAALNTTIPSANNLIDFCQAYDSYWRCLSGVQNCSYRATVFKAEMDQYCKNITWAGVCSTLQQLKCAENVTKLLDKIRANRTESEMNQLCKASDDHITCLHQYKCSTENNIPTRLSNLTQSCVTVESSTRRSAAPSSTCASRCLCVSVLISLVILLVTLL